MSRDTKTILAIETSCDETAIAVVECSGNLKNPQFKIRANIVSSQIKLHAPFGGVVPNLAKREHIKNLPIVLGRALRKANLLSSNDKDTNYKRNPKPKPNKKIDCIAVTIGPGLEPALWTGINFAQKLAEEWRLPVIGVNHMEGHIVAVLLQKSNVKSQKSKLLFPAVALLVSGGHTELVLVKNWPNYKIIGKTLDDAAGEAFDKVARMLGLSYPGGPEIARLARTGNRYTFSFPRPMLHPQASGQKYNFSFSGLKTAVLYTLRDLEARGAPYSKNDVAASFQDAAIDVLLAKTVRAAREFRARSVIVGGGVSANNSLRKRFKKAFAGKTERARLFLSPLAFTGDNAAMIAAAAYFRFGKSGVNWKKLAANATLSI